MNKSQRALLFQGQLLHLICLALLLALLAQVESHPSTKAGSFLGISSPNWAGLAVLNAIAHQIYVWLCWRLELGSQTLTRTFSEKAFPLFRIGFAILFVFRPILIFSLAWANRGTLPIPTGLSYLIAFALLIPTFYLAYSVHRYFGIDRAFGIDHFDPSARDLPLVKDGIFAWTPNAMYVFGFFILWVPAFLFQSSAALAIAAFSHAYIWVHYYCTEKPDMERIYG